MQGTRLQHVKPHGALYNMAVQNIHIWEATAEVIAGIDKNLILVALGGRNRDQLKAIGDRYGIRVAFEFFADRAYNPNGSLVSRQDPGAVIQDEIAVARRVIKMVSDGKVAAKDGTEVSLTADTICVHGDNPAAVRLIKRIRESLTTAGIDMMPIGAFL